MSSSELRDAILSALERGLFADNLRAIAADARKLAGGDHDVATWALIYLGFNALAEAWEDPVDAGRAAAAEEALFTTCADAVREQTPFARERLARAIVHALAILNDWRT